MQPDDAALSARRDALARQIDADIASTVRDIRESRSILNDETLLTDDTIASLTNDFSVFETEAAYMVAVATLARTMVLLSRTDMFTEGVD